MSFAKSTRRCKALRSVLDSSGMSLFFRSLKLVARERTSERTESRSELLSSGPAASRRNRLTVELDDHRLLREIEERELELRSSCSLSDREEDSRDQREID